MVKSKLTKSRDRIKAHGEVYTSINIVQGMLDLVSQDSDIWDIGKRWLEPTCGNGVFIGEVVKRKLSHCLSMIDGLNALKDIYVIDILEDNVYQARCQALGQFVKWCIYKDFDCPYKEGSIIIDRNIVCGDALHPETVLFYDWVECREFKLSDLL